MRFVDSHVHLDAPDASASLALASATETLLLGCGVDRKTSMAIIRLARADSHVRAFVGVHPSEATKDPNPSWLSETVESATGIGEIGLDPKYSSVGEGSAQRIVFLTQLKAAETWDKPVQVHSREAESDCLEILEGFHLKSVLMHWFQSEEGLRRVEDNAYFVSFGPSLLYSKKLQRMAASCDRQLVVAETDFPVTYAPLGGVHGSHLVTSVIFKLSEVWACTFEEARTITTRNAIRFLNTSGKG